jgi:hypothetical protein
MRRLRARRAPAAWSSPGALAGMLATLVLPASVPAAAFASASAISTALPRAPVELVVESCPQVDAQALRHMLSLEIGDLLLPDDAPSESPRGERLTVRCADGQARLSAGGSGPARAIERSVRLADFPDDATARVLALAGVELLASVDAPPAAAVTTVPATRPAAPEDAPGRKDDDESPSRSRSLLSRARLALVLMRRAFLSDAGVTAWGASASASSDLNAGWAVRGDLDGGVAHSSNDAGVADSYLLSAGAFWGPRFGRGEMAGSLGVGARLGLTRFAGQPSPFSPGVNTSSVVRAWGGPSMMVQVRNGGAGWGLLLYAESGVTVLGAVGASDLGSVAAVRGIWLTVGAGLSL